LDIYFFTLFDLNIKALSSIRKIFWIFLSYLLSILFRKSKTALPSYPYNNVHTSYHLCGHGPQTHLTILLFWSFSAFTCTDDQDVPLWVFAVAGPFSSTYSNTESDEAVLYLSCCSISFFPKLIMDHCFFI